MNEILKGIVTSGTLIVAIGAQNAFVLKQGLLRNNIFWVVLVCFLCDVLLMCMGVLGIGTVIKNNMFANVGLASVGGLFLLLYGFKSFRSAFSSSHTMDVSTAPKITSIPKTILLTLAITLLNPHVYLDTVVIIGGIAGTLTFDQKVNFLIGALIASFVWFFGLGYGARWLIPVFKEPKAWKILDFGIGCLMFWLSYQLIQFALEAI
ncbi:LysE/ArgO family amino acid transporter [Exiguobacterium sp. SL14]|nr:LysE/ArgO family amino acid transporter [Exiguobacterium sp. SL14]MCY1689754.1 LysE/ArgO family amino acid transporter [Exiguobacterium sp. SL14]